ncbi:MAG: hypothetical protein J6A69_13070 [Clostridia bacterium]|nr:hypothetical protein [Clostridia bacterium]
MYVAESFLFKNEFKAFGELYSLKNEVLCETENNDIYVLAATDGKSNAVLITNTGEDDKIEINLTSDYTVYLIDENNLMTETDKNPVIFNLGKNQAILIKNNKLSKT